MLGTFTAFLRRERAIRINLPFEAFEELVSAGLCAGSPVCRAAPGDVRADPAVQACLP
jgi:hypothetical protein